MKVLKRMINLRLTLEVKRFIELHTKVVRVIKANMKRITFNSLSYNLTLNHC